MKLLTKSKLNKIKTEAFFEGRRQGIAEFKDLQNLNRPQTFCNTGCRTTKCVKAAPKERK